MSHEHEFSYSEADFEKIRKVIYHKAGINLSDSKKQLVYSRLARRVRALKLPNFSAYLHYLNDNEQEHEEFVNALTTNLTAFFREPHHFDILANHINKVKNQNRKLRIWCAASSTGEEPYSIAMTAVEAYGTYEPPIEIIASDIDSNVLREASAGIYSLARLESLSLTQKKQFFQRGKGSNSGKARVVEELRNLIDFKKINLLDSQWPLQPPFDIIFCRNVMIYFDKATQLSVLERMTKLMRPDGLYIAGHSESFSQAAHLVKLVGKTTYTLVTRKDAANEI
ncbi:CheR family methyltransferase [Cellvibrio zantedeschiae]|uniref:CheR family methyltransferase n=1 Tax=Cellvibrio zantedeschiae TaxID=1237077 RepID=UPI001E513AAA|nr:CheR family methyltransferase [Cellvibrio zantedeschiae]